jgi:peptidoglycan hydrolase-like protein with peptidoglycan-binding domain
MSRWVRMTWLPGPGQTSDRGYRTRLRVPTGLGLTRSVGPRHPTKGMIVAHPTTQVAHPTIRRGSKGGAVKEAQRALEARGYSVGSAGVDGIYGIYTYRAVLNYQFDRSAGQFWAHAYPLEVDGIVGPRTWGRLSPETISNGSRGEGVRLAQDILKGSGVPSWDPGVVDEIFGPKTEQAVRNFQTDLDLTVDGIVGPVTWRSLWS